MGRIANGCRLNMSSFWPFVLLLFFQLFKVGIPRHLVLGGIAPPLILRNRGGDERGGDKWRRLGIPCICLVRRWHCPAVIHQFASIILFSVERFELRLLN